MVTCSHYLLQKRVYGCEYPKFNTTQETIHYVDVPRFDIDGIF